MNIKYAQLEDAESLTELAVKTFRNSYLGQVDLDDLDAYITPKFTVRNFKAEISDPKVTVLLALELDELIGYVILKHGEPNDHVQDEYPMNLASIYLDEVVIGKGHGSLLMQKVLDETTIGNYKSIWLSVWAENSRAIAFYKKWKYEVVGQLIFRLVRSSTLT